ncbi:hypothetical protein J7E62_29005 [Variovorax paradoxus]|nr:hypothetical protein [Variovorax paradoxus]
MVLHTLESETYKRRPSWNKHAHIHVGGNPTRSKRSVRAGNRRGRVCSVAKENVMEAGALWREEVQALCDEEFRDVELSHMLADNGAMQLVRAPAQFDVIVTDGPEDEGEAAARAAGQVQPDTEAADFDQWLEGSVEQAQLLLKLAPAAIFEARRCQLTP